jgi:hypothetical protein
MIIIRMKERFILERFSSNTLFLWSLGKITIYGVDGSNFRPLNATGAIYLSDLGFPKMF